MRLPAGHRNPVDIKLTQWLDPDRVVLDAGSDDGTDLLVCRLSTSGCRVAVRIVDANYTAPGPVVSHG